MKPKFSILRTEPRTLRDILVISLHNSREIPVPNADPSKPDGFELIRCDGEEALFAVVRRVFASGAKRPGRNRAWAMEVMGTFSDHAEPMPSRDVVIQRGVKFLDKTYGRANVVAVWYHEDESTPHLHAFVVPICTGLSPGRPPGPSEEDDDEEAPREAGLIVSWHQFSGSSTRNYRDPKRAKTPKAKARVARQKLNRANKIMADWQTEWARIWEDYGLRRGIPSKRGYLPMKWIHEQQARTIGLGEATIRDVEQIIRDVKLSGADLAELARLPSAETFRKIAQARLMPEIRSNTAQMASEAMRGIQLDVEREARVEAADRASALEKEAQSLRSADKGGSQELQEKRMENQYLKEEVASLQAALERPDPETEQRVLGNLSDEQLEQYMALRKAGKLRMSTPGLNPLPTPRKGLDGPGGPKL